MWFGTDNGLAQFDGRRIQTFTLGNADSNRILVLKTSPTGLFLMAWKLFTSITLLAR